MTVPNTDGIYPGVTREVYERIQRANWSSLKHMGQSPFHFRAAQMAPDEDTDAKRLGRATHVATLEPERFRATWAVWDGGTRRGKEWDAFSKKHTTGGIDILTAAQYERCQGIAKAALSNELAAKYLRGGKSEVTMLWTDKTTGLECKGRLDFSAETVGALADLKTSEDVGRDAFKKTAFNYGYHCQAAFYCDGYFAITGKRLPYVIVAVESSEPHDVVVYRVKRDVLAVGRSVYTGYLEQLAWCRKENRYDGQSGGEELDLELPTWGMPKNEDVAALGPVGFELEGLEERSA